MCQNVSHLRLAKRAISRRYHEALLSSSIDDQPARRTVRDRVGHRDAFLCGNEITLADYLGSMMVLGGEVIDCKFGAYPNICRWLGKMKTLKSWTGVNEAFYKFIVEPNKGKAFVQL